MAGCRVAMQIEAPGRLQHALNLIHPLRHAHQIGQQSAVAQDGLQALEQFDGLPGIAPLVVGDDLLKPGYRQFVPGPGIDERLSLRLIILPDVVVNLEVVALGVEWRVDVAQIHRFIPQLAPQDVQIVTVVERVIHRS